MWQVRCVQIGVDYINPKNLCRFACKQYKNGCTHAITDTTTIYENKTNGVNCDELNLRDYNGIDIPTPYTFTNDNKDLRTFLEQTKYNKEKKDYDTFYNIICYQPTWLNNSFVDPITKLHYLELCYVYRSSIITQIVSKQDVLTINGLKGLTSLGLNVPESMTKQLTDYYATYISDSKTLLEKMIYSRFGWSIDKCKFVIGETVISEKTTNSAHLINIISETVQAFEQTGTTEGWIDATSGLLVYDNVRFVCYAATTALILKVMGGASFVVELVGDTSKGKTITAQLAMSIFGNPEKLKLATSATKVFIERMCATCNDLPLFLDETSLMEPQMLKELTYMVANERGKGRGKKEGGVSEIDRWKTVLITTGETPLTNTTSLGGQDVRTVSLYGGIGAYDPENVEYFKDHLEENCGVIAPLIIKKIIENGTELKELYGEIRNTIKEYGKSDTTGAMGRVVDTYALIALAGMIFENVLDDLGHEVKDARELVIQRFKDKLTHSDGSLPDRAFAIIIDWIMENKKNFCEDKEGPAGERYDLYGNISMEFPDENVPFDYVDIIPSKLYEILDKKLGHPGISKRIVLDWADGDKIVVGADGKKQIKATIKTGTKQTRVVRLKLSLLDEDTKRYDF